MQRAHFLELQLQHGRGRHDLVCGWVSKVLLKRL